jgi:hypothetical protein
MGIAFACAFAQKLAARAGVWSMSQPNPLEALMAINSTRGTFEECADELSDFVITLEKYPHTVLAFALRAHLGGLLQALRAHGRWSADEVTTFIKELEYEVLQPDQS